MHWLIDDYDQQGKSLLWEVWAQGHVGVSLKRRAFADTQHWRDAFPASTCVMFHGSLEMAKAIKEHAPGWVPGVYYSHDPYSCTSYYPALGPYLLNETYAMIPFGDLVRQRDFLFDTFAEDGCLFLRPNRGDKTFTGQLIEAEADFAAQLDDLGYDQIPAGDLCIVAPPCNIRHEWRFVAVDGHIIAGSQYRKEGYIHRERTWTEDAMGLARAVARAYTPDPDRAWTIDICETRGGRTRLLEINSFCCAGLYECDPEPIVREVSRVAMEDWRASRPGAGGNP